VIDKLDDDILSHALDIVVVPDLERNVWHWVAFQTLSTD
jgi:hypothetical protein